MCLRVYLCLSNFFVSASPPPSACARLSTVTSVYLPMNALVCACLHESDEHLRLGQLLEEPSIPLGVGKVTIHNKHHV